MAPENLENMVSVEGLDAYTSVDDIDEVEDYEGQEESEETFSETTPPEKIAKWIRESGEDMKHGSDILATTMDLPPVNRVKPENFIKALHIVFSEYGINKIPDEITEAILQREFESFEFLVPARVKHLQPRHVEINTFPEISTLTIRGAEPVDGNDGSIEVFFDFRIQPGKYLPDGSIDFREINRFPQACEDECVFRVYQPTPGSPGTDAYGLPIAPKPGSPFPVKPGDGLREENGYDEERKEHYKDYFCKKAGIIVCEFEGPADPQNIRAISIKNEIVVKDIDFTTGSLKGQAGELRCKANVLVEGDIRGHFSVVIDGALNVKGAVEGATVDATGPVVAAFVRNFLRSGNDMEIGSARNATLVASQTAKIKRELAECQIKAPYILFQPHGNPEIMIGRTIAEADMVKGGPLNVRNIFEIEIGKRLFETLAQLQRQYCELEEEEVRTAASLRDRGAVMGRKLKLASSILDDEQKKFIPVIKQFATMILLGKIPIGKIKERVLNFEQSYGADFRSIVRHLKLMVDIQEHLTEITEQKDLLAKQKEQVEAAIAELSVDIKGRLASAGQVIVRCDGREKRWSLKNANIKNFHIVMKYDPKRGPYFIDKDGNE